MTYNHMDKHIDMTAYNIGQTDTDGLGDASWTVLPSAGALDTC